jgi:hypothetical protein
MSQAEVALLSAQSDCAPAPASTGRALLGASCSLSRVRALRTEVALAKLGGARASAKSSSAALAKTRARLTSDQQRAKKNKKTSSKNGKTTAKSNKPSRPPRYFQRYATKGIFKKKSTNKK